MAVEPHPLLLQRLMAERGIKQADIMRALDESKQSVNKLYKGTTEMSKRWAERLAPLLGVPWPQLMGFEGVTVGVPEMPHRPPPRPSRLTPETLVIKEYDVTAQGGDGASLADLDGPERHPELGQWTLPADLLNAHLTPGMHPVVIRMVGNSMEPELASGDRVMVDTSARTPTPPGIYVLWDGLGLIIKQCELVMGSDPIRVRITSLNPSYAAYDLELSDVRIQGRVMGKWMWK